MLPSPPPPPLHRVGYRAEPPILMAGSLLGGEGSSVGPSGAHNSASQEKPAPWNGSDTSMQMGGESKFRFMFPRYRNSNFLQESVFTKIFPHFAAYFSKLFVVFLCSNGLNKTSV